MPQTLSSKKSKDKKPRVAFGSKHITVEDSSLVEKVFYDPNTLTLDAVFKKGTRYRYKRVPPKVFSQFVLAKSMGKFFNAKIRNHYAFQLVS